jgi:hypothetical protein
MDPSQRRQILQRQKLHEKEREQRLLEIKSRKINEQVAREQRLKNLASQVRITNRG